MKLINKSQVSHVEAYKENIGVWSKWYGFVNYVFMQADYFHLFWFIKTPLKNYKKGYYRDTKRKWITNDTPFKIQEDKHFVVGDYVWTYPHIDIYVGKELIHTKYFKTYKDLEKHLEDNYDNVNIRYE